MNELPSNPILEFNQNQLAEVRKIFNYEDINRLHQDLNIFDDWIKMQPHFLSKDYDKEYLERYLIHSKGSVERAKKLFDRVCTLRGLMPEYLQGFDIENEFQNHLKIFDVCILPKPTADNHRVLFHSIRNPDTVLFDHLEAARYMLLIFHYLFRYDYNTGIELVCDTRNFTLGIISQISPLMLSNTIMIMHQALGLRLRGFHLISGSKFIDLMVGLIKQGMSKKLTSRLHVHESYESLYKLIPKDKLPEDIGGDLDSANKLTEQVFKELTSPTFNKHLKYMEGATTDESKRLSCKFNEEYSGMPGSFKVLTVD